jgi:hypothetical protein
MSEETKINRKCPNSYRTYYWYWIRKNENPGGKEYRRKREIETVDPTKKNQNQFMRVDKTAISFPTSFPTFSAS